MIRSKVSKTFSVAVSSWSATWTSTPGSATGTWCRRFQHIAALDRPYGLPIHPHKSSLAGARGITTRPLPDHVEDPTGDLPEFSCMDIQATALPKARAQIDVCG